jgi:hypothetical protein
MSPPSTSCQLHAKAPLCSCLIRRFSAVQEDSKALGGVAPVGYLAGVAGFELLPIFAPRPVAPVSGFLFGVLRLRLWLSLLAGLFFGPLQVSKLHQHLRVRIHADQRANYQK